MDKNTYDYLRGGVMESVDIKEYKRHHNLKNKKHYKSLRKKWYEKKKKELAEIRKKYVDL
tara:strand:- start:773 stop:952 length:180 start_codon:yes stop_codon:yes gene_type:complete